MGTFPAAADSHDDADKQGRGQYQGEQHQEEILLVFPLLDDAGDDQQQEASTAARIQTWVWVKSGRESIKLSITRRVSPII